MSTEAPCPHCPHGPHCPNAGFLSLLLSSPFLSTRVLARTLLKQGLGRPELEGPLRWWDQLLPPTDEKTRPRRFHSGWKPSSQSKSEPLLDEPGDISSGGRTPGVGKAPRHTLAEDKASDLSYRICNLQMVGHLPPNYECTGER